MKLDLVRCLTMAYRALILMVLAVIIFTSPSVRTATPTSQNRISCVRDIVTIGGGIVGVGATLWKLVTDYKSWQDKNTVYSYVPRMPSNHLFQPREKR